MGRTNAGMQTTHPGAKALTHGGVDTRSVHRDRLLISTGRRWMDWLDWLA
jgi:hypothetical protein